MPYYAVAKGRSPGIYDSWDDCSAQVNRYSGSVYKKFDTMHEAQNFIEERSSSSAEPSYGGNYGCSSGYSRSYTPKRTYSTNYNYNRYGEGNSDFLVDDDGYVNVYTDGACSSNGYNNARAGVGVWFNDNHSLNLSEPAKGRATNNNAEIQAVTQAARQAQKAGIQNLKINTDSKFLIDCATEWMPNWKNRGWKTADSKPVVNKQELLEMDQALKPFNNVAWNHVSGHAGIHGNEMADKLAREGSQRYKN